MAYLLSGNMDKGSLEYQLEAAISKVYSSVSILPPPLSLLPLPLSPFLSFTYTLQALYLIILCMCAYRKVLGGWQMSAFSYMEGWVS